MPLPTNASRSCASSAWTPAASSAVPAAWVYTTLSRAQTSCPARSCTTVSIPPSRLPSPAISTGTRLLRASIGSTSPASPRLSARAQRSFPSNPSRKRRSAASPCPATSTTARTSGSTASVPPRSCVRSQSMSMLPSQTRRTFRSPSRSPLTSTSSPVSLTAASTRLSATRSLQSTRT